jgi:signal transduction histidine kinase
MSYQNISSKILFLTLTAFMIFIWLVLGMVYSGHYIPPFDRLNLWLMPWKALDIITPAGMDERLSIMQDLLDASIRISHYALVAMIVSFTAFITYLSVIYQQQKRKSRENMLLVLKNQEIARRNEFIRYISATIGHEFKNNLGRIKRRIDLLPELQPDSKERIDNNLKKMFADIDIFKKISDEREAALIEFRNINLKSMIEDLAKQYSDLADIAIHNNVTAPMIYAAPPLLKTVFENVFDNTVKYKKPEQARADVTVSCIMESDGTRRYVTISISDKGIGMDEQQADICFYKGKGIGENWGQGLYFAKYVVGLHAGRIRIGKEYTAPGTGTEVIINLPFVAEVQNV